MSTPLPVQVDVDQVSGRWVVDGIPMILVPQHLLTGMLTTAERSAGTDRSAGTVHAAGYAAARHWCAQQRDHLGLHGTELVAHYLAQLGHRGWGQFTITTIDLAARTIDVRVDHSAFATRNPPMPGNGACYPFTGWLDGAVDYAADPSARPDPTPRVAETQCVATGAEHCRFSSCPG